MGKPVAFFDKYSRGAKDYYTLAKEVILLERQQSEAETVSQSESAPQKVTETKEEVVSES